MGEEDGGVSGERFTLWAMVAVGLRVWAVGIPTLQTWLIITGAVLVWGAAVRASDRVAEHLERGRVMVRRSGCGGLAKHALPLS